MGGTRRWCAVFVGIACLAPGSALAAVANVSLGNGRTISPTLVTIDPGDTVTWTWVGPVGDTNHTTTSPIPGNAPGAEVWESNPGQADNNVVDSPVGRTFSHTFTEPGTYLYGCRVHDVMRATVKVRGLPTAVITANDTTPVTGQVVTFDGSGSFDDPPGTPLAGEITKYEWDLDGNVTTGSGGFEADTGTLSSTTSSYATTGSRTVRLRVTDNDVPARTAIGSVNVTVLSPAPVATFNVLPASPQKGQQVTFSSTSEDPDDSIVTHEWDLDGNPTNGVDGFEVNTGTGLTAMATYAVAGPKTVRLRVTDQANHQTIASKTFTVANQLPTASFTATPSTVLIGETVSFDGIDSADVPPGTVASYAWDLDGNPSTGPAGFETSTGATPTTSRSYDAAGSVAVRLRVTDDDGGTNTTTRAVTVNAPPSSNPPPQDPPPAESPPPVLPAPSIGGGSAPVLPPTLTLRGPAKQRALRQRGILVTGTCDRACSLAARGTVNVPGASKVFRLRPARRSLTAAGNARLKLAIPRAAQTAIRRALRSRKRVTATITVAATDASGTSTRTRRVTLTG